MLSYHLSRLLLWSNTACRLMRILWNCISVTAQSLNVALIADIDKRHASKQRKHQAQPYNLQIKTPFLPVDRSLFFFPPQIRYSRWRLLVGLDRNINSLISTSYRAVTFPLIRESKGRIPVIKSGRKSETSCKFVLYYNIGGREYEPIHYIKNRGRQNLLKTPVNVNEERGRSRNFQKKKKKGVGGRVQMVRNMGDCRIWRGSLAREKGLGGDEVRIMREGSFKLEGQAGSVYSTAYWEAIPETAILTGTGNS